MMTRSAIAKSLFAVVIAVCLGPMSAEEALADRPKLKVDAFNITGPNSLFGNQLWSNPGPAGGSFTFVAGYNPDGPDPIPLTAETPLDTLLATTFSPVLHAIVGLPDPDPSLLNVPINSTPVVVGPSIFARAPVPDALDAPPTSVTSSRKPVTLGQWLEASGKATIKCRRDGTTTIDLKFRKLIPNGVYTLWFETTFFPYPLGGVPNAMIPNAKGRASYSRTVAGCILEPVPGEDFITAITLEYHSDGQVYGGFPVPVLDPGFASGVQAQDQLAFPVNAEVL